MANITPLQDAGPLSLALGESDAVAACAQAWFDGAALPNPGKMGLGVVLYLPDGARHAVSVVAEGWGCNNEAELLALIAALELAQRLGVRRLQVYGDSDLAVRAAAFEPGNGRAVVIPATQVDRLRRLMDRLPDLTGGFDFLQVIWRPRHRNGEADALSRLALGLPDKPAPVPRSKKRRRR